jgi:hypothetical protein
MFHVKAIVNGRCVMCDRECETLVVEAPEQRIAGLLCMADFKRLLKAAGAKPPAEKAAPSSEPKP